MNYHDIILYFRYTYIKTLQTQKPCIRPSFKIRVLHSIRHKLLFKEWFEYIILIIIIIHSLILTFITPIPKYIKIIFLCVFVVEIILKCIGFNIYGYYYDPYLHRKDESNNNTLINNRGLCNHNIATLNTCYIISQLFHSIIFNSPTAVTNINNSDVNINTSSIKDISSVPIPKLQSKIHNKNINNKLVMSPVNHISNIPIICNDISVISSLLPSLYHHNASHYHIQAQLPIDNHQYLHYLTQTLLYLIFHLIFSILILIHFHYGEICEPDGTQCVCSTFIKNCISAPAGSLLAQNSRQYSGGLNCCRGGHNLIHASHYNLPTIYQQTEATAGEYDIPHAFTLPNIPVVGYPN